MLYRYRTAEDSIELEGWVVEVEVAEQEGWVDEVENAKRHRPEELNLLGLPDLEVYSMVALEADPPPPDRQHHGATEESKRAWLSSRS